ncbi:MAG: hypothetical protein HY040_10860 [Planctomycetes bacterium]|nr:hypothetical protein [Planctomycetota bacterium]
MIPLLPLGCRLEAGRLKPELTLATSSNYMEASAMPDLRVGPVEMEECVQPLWEWHDETSALG